MIKVGVIGAAGRMGSATCDAVENEGDLELVARIGHQDELSALVETGAEVAVEFTRPASVLDNTLFCLRNGIHAVVGATGLGREDLKDIARVAKETNANAVIVPNFALGAVLMMKFAADAARYYARAEIIERHHEQKVDAPSGTSLRTKELMEAARKDAGAQEIPIHSVRLPGLVAHQEVVFGAAGETLTIKHDSLDRSSFMPGVVLAIRKVGTLPPLTVGLEHLLDA
jgi:4-hydroxy-tetrahydrodipicolinate reductase